MLAPPVVRAGVPRQKSTNSPVPPNRRSASSNSRVAPLALPPISGSAPHSRSGSRSAIPNTPYSDEQQAPLSARQAFLSTPGLETGASALLTQYRTSSGGDATSPSFRSQQLDLLSAPNRTSSPSYDAPSPSASASASAADSQLPTEQHAWWLTFASAYHEAQFRLFMRSQTDTRLASVMFVALYAGAIAEHAARFNDNSSLQEPRMVLLLLSFLLTAVSLVWCHLHRRYETRQQLLVLAVSVASCALWVLAFEIHTAALGQACQPASLMLFNVLWLYCCRPLLFPHAAVHLFASSVLFTAVTCADPAVFTTAAELFFASLCVWVQAAVLAVYLRGLDESARSQYCHALSLHILQQRNQQLTSDTRQLKSDFFVLTLERFDIADVEEEGKVLSSAMEQAMGKLQALGKNQQLPPAVLKEIMAVVSLLGSGSDLFKAKMEHTSLAGEDDEMTRYINETLNGEHGRGSSNTPTQRSLTYQPAKHHTASASDLSTITEGAATTAVVSALVGVGMEVASEADRSLSGLLAQLEDWNLDLFEVSNMTAGRPLYFIGMALLRRYDCLAEFGLDAVRLSNYLREMEAGYGTHNPYHNSIHAADVARSVHFFIQCGRLTHYCSKLEIFTLIIASLAHDFQHPGKNNAYLISVRDERALIYNDRSVLENFHTAQTFHLLLNSNSSGGGGGGSCNFLAHLPHKDFLAFRKLAVELVLATDLAHSNEFLGRFKNWHVNAQPGGVAAASGGSGGAAVASSPLSGLGVGVGGGVAESGVVGVAALDNEARLLVMKMALKCADIGHSAKRLQLHEKWTARITEEFYRQGDEERKQQLPISPFMDRRKANLSQSQTGFIDYVCQPLYTAWFKFLDPDEKRQRELHTERLRLERERADTSGGADSARKPSGGGGEAEVGAEFEWVRKRTASQMRMDEELVTVLEQLKRNREHWKTWQGPSAKT